MKKYFLSLLLACICVNVGYTQTLRYLNKVHQPTDSYFYVPLEGGETMEIGGVEYKNGFYLSHSSSNDTHGWVEFSLKGKYKTLTFIYGSSDYWDRVGLLVIRGDGKKLLETKVRGISTPERMSIDVTGVDVLRFEALVEDVQIGVAEPLLWTAGEKPKETGVLTNATGKPIMLVRDMLPFFMSGFHDCVSEREQKVPGTSNLYKNFVDYVKITGTTYGYGISMNANMQLIGSDERCTYFNVGGKYKTLQFVAGPQDSDSGTLGIAWLTVKGDGKILLEEEMHESNIAKKFTVDISGCKMISFESQQAEGSSDIAAVNIMLYPEGHKIAEEAVEGVALEVDDKLKSLPDVCKLISNIPPYAVGGGISREDMVYDGSLDLVTFSMGGIKYNEGLIMRSSTHILNDNTHCHAVFNLGGQFDYITFTTGWISKCGVLKNDVLRVYADEKLVYEVPLIATMPNIKHVVKINKCNQLKFEEVGMAALSHPVWGVADIVAYRGEPVENDLFVHPKPECPPEIDLIDLGRPYIHYVHSFMSQADELVKDGTSKKDFFSMPGGGRINKGFLLKTSVHFDMESGPLGGEGAGAGIAAVGFGSSIMLGSVGGATISAVSPFGALIALAAGGTSYETSCAAFNTWGEYDYVTFTVACRMPSNTDDPISVKTNPVDTVLIGADHQVVSTIYVHEKMQPTTYTVPIKRCHQLMFWMKCGGWGSGQFIFYDLKLKRGDAPEAVAPNVNASATPTKLVASAEPYVLPVVLGDKPKPAWERPDDCASSAINDYFDAAEELFEFIEEFYEEIEQDYHSVATHITSEDGTPYRCISIEKATGEKYSISGLVERNEVIIEMVNGMKTRFSTLALGKVNANIGLVELGLKAIEYRKYIKQLDKVIDTYKAQLNQLQEEKKKEIEILRQLQADGLSVDGKVSNDGIVYVK